MAGTAKTTNTVDKEYTFFCDIPFSHRYNAMKSGAKWDASRKCWYYKGKSLPVVLQPFHAPLYSYPRLIENRINKAKPSPSIPTKNIVPREHQFQAIDAIVRAYRIGRVGFLLADEVGLGKTITTWGSLLALSKLQRILIVCPLAVCSHWRNTIQWMGDGGKEIVIINYDRLQNLFTYENDGKKHSLKSKSRIGKPMEFDAVIWDECHKLKNPTAARSRFALKINAKASFRLWLSATAGSTPLELSTISPLLAQMTGAKVSDLKEFEKWCEEQKWGVSKEKSGRWIWTGNKEDTARVHKMLFGGAIPAGIRRRPEEIAGWPEINRILYPIDLEGEKSVLYESAWREFRDAIGLEKKGHRNPKDALATRLRFRQKSSLLRSDGTAAFIKLLRENGHQVAVSVAFHETLERLKIELSDEVVATIHGRQNPEEKEKNRLSFQNGHAPIVLFTVEEGISLHQGEYNDIPRSQIIHDLRWSAIQMAQIEGRTHRNGKFSQIYWVFAPDTIDQRIAEVVVGKLRTMKEMVGDDVETLQEIEKLLIGED